MAHTKETQIFQFLMEHKDRFVTSKELAEYLSCSDRTVRNYLKLIDQTLDVQGVQLLSKQGQGYRIVFESQEAYRQFCLTYGIGETFSSPQGEDRLAFILNKLLFEQLALRFDDLADELYVSRSTLSHDFKKIRHLLADYQLTIESRANKGVYVAGKERDKRRFIMDYFLENLFLKTLHSQVASDLFDSSLSLEELAKIVLEECQEAQLRLSDFVLQNLVVHIALAMERIKLGFEIQQLDTALSGIDKEQTVAQKILDRISERTQLDFPVQEVDYITLHLLAKSQAFQGTQAEQLKEELRKSLVEAFRTLGLEEIYHFTSDFQLMEGLLAHLLTLQVRLKSHIALTNPLAEDIQRNYNDIFFLTKELLNNMVLFSGDQISDDEIAYVSLHFLAALERQKEHRRFSVLAICATGIGAAQMLRNRLENEFGDRIEIRDVVGYYELSQEKLQGIDFIVSAVDLSNLYFQIPVFTVSVFLKPEEVAQIRQAMGQMQAFHCRRNSESLPPSINLFTAYFSEAHFLVWKNPDRQGLLEAMVDTLSVGESADFKDLMLEAISQRESLSSIVFSEKIAVPHPVRPIGQEIKVAIAICRFPLAWDSQSHQVQLVFLLSPSVYGNEGLKEVTDKIIFLMEREDLQQALIACQNVEEFLTIFEKVV